MTRPTHYLIRMLVFLVAVGVIAFLLQAALVTAFATNPLLNALILLVLAIGILWNLRQVMRISPEVTWVETFQQARTRLAGLPAPRLLAPMAQMLAARAAKAREAGREDKFTLSGPAMRALLDSIASRLDESRELSRYMVGLLIFLGLLGTFWGLLLTVSSVGDVIANMSVGTGDINVLFEQLKSGLAKPLKGMGTAFSSSMLGLSGALVLGFLDLTAGQAQNRFFNELEEWLAGITRLGSGALGGDGEGSVPAYVQALLEQTAENMESLQTILSRGEDGRRESNQTMLALAEKVGLLTDNLRASQMAMQRMEETHQALLPALQRLGESRESSGDDAARAHLRNIDVLLQRLIAEMENGRNQSTAEIRNEIKILTKTIATITDDRTR
jgi:hypothetical protein